MPNPPKYISASELQVLNRPTSARFTGTPLDAGSRYDENISTAIFEGSMRLGDDPRTAQE